ncbi:MATE family efflux transporter [Verrucomicrobiaceae bacterium 227]
MREGRGTLLLALPLMAGQVSQMLMVVVDTLMIGRLGTVDLAAATLAQTILHIPLMLGIGIAIAVSIKVSQARGAQTPERARIAVQHGFFLSLVLGALTFAISLAMLPLLPYLGQDPRVVDRVPTFFLLVSASMIPALASMAARSHADAMARPWPAFWIILGGVLLNVFLNWVLIGGKLGAPAMGLEGAGWATLIARIVTLVGVLMWLRNSPQLRNWIPEHWFRIPERKPLYDFWKIVWPSSLQVSAEISAFIAASFLIGTLGAEALAAHQVAITCVSTIFMVPLGLSMAVTVQIGEAFGATTHERARPIVLSAWAMGLTFSLIFVGVFFVFGETIARWFLTETGPVEIVTGLFVIAAFFQIGDHSQILSSGVMRGLDDVRTPALMTFVAHWVIGMPLGYYLTFGPGMGAAGVWWGLSTGLTLAAIFLGARAWKLTAPAVENSGLQSA